MEDRVRMGQGLCYSTSGWFAVLMQVTSVEDETGERWGLAVRKTDLLDLCRS